MTISGLFDQTRAIPTPVATGGAFARPKAVSDAENMAEKAYASRVCEHPTTKVGRNRTIIGLNSARAALVGIIYGPPIPGAIAGSP